MPTANIIGHSTPPWCKCLACRTGGTSSAFKSCHAQKPPQSYNTAKPFHLTIFYYLLSARVQSETLASIKVQSVGRGEWLRTFCPVPIESTSRQFPPPVGMLPFPYHRPSNYDKRSSNHGQRPSTLTIHIKPIAIVFRFPKILPNQSTWGLTASFM
jgi:hypothetical protein